ncbi:MAG TPA: PQQ-binding-like beta-propeller repeat protein [Gaiellaceae bacterium]|nr:PQQ-binding-like beta-propeller repeat protein [Gaiellaceae bacterium]
MRRWLLVLGGLVVLAVLGAGIAYYEHIKHAERNIQGSSTVEFVTTPAPPPAPKEPGVAWPTYGYDSERLRFINGSTLAPPFTRAWTFHARSLVEFPPAVAYGRLFFSNNDGTMFAVGARNGRKAWSYVSHRCVAASPAVDHHVVFESFMNAPPCNRKPSAKLTGQVIAFAVGTGKILWKRTIGPSESSPVVVGAAVFVGDWNGRVWALRRRTGKPFWTTKLRAQVKGGVAISGSRLYVADYSGHVYSLSRSSGKVLWQAKAQPRFGSTGTFYATPAVAYGRVYVGATDGKMYSYGATTGKLRWSHGTGGYVYSSAAVWRDRVFVGSYSHKFFCFDAATGALEWVFTANGPISGSPTVVAGRVYFATLKGRTYALDARTGALAWTYPDGKYSPVVADSARLYLIGYAKIYGLDEKRAKSLRKLSEGTALRALRRAGFKHLRVIGTHPLAIKIGVDKHRGRRNVCHIALFGADPNVAKGAKALSRLCVG